MEHEHSHSAGDSLVRLVWAGFLNIAIAVVEFLETWTRTPNLKIKGANPCEDGI